HTYRSFLQNHQFYVYFTEIIETFASFPNVTFLWKYEIDDLDGILKSYRNIHIKEWFPQVDLLADPRLTIFITHGGMNSILEAIYYAKPMIVVPLFADQQCNSKNVERKGLGILLKRHLLNKKTLTNALKRIMGNKWVISDISFTTDCFLTLTSSKNFERIRCNP
ncbi:unnamed protein product, partial [Strongylus vulgaris]